MKKVSFATCSAIPALTSGDKLAAQALRRRGFICEPLVWNGDETKAHESDLVIIRSVWDYHYQPERFAAWLKNLESGGIQLLNSPELVRWNIRKEYLLELAQQAITIVPTLLLTSQTAEKADGFLRRHQSTKAVVKPLISASAFNTFLLEKDISKQVNALLQRSPRWLLQPFMPEITRGEWSLIFFDGHYTLVSCLLGT